MVCEAEGAFLGLGAQLETEQALVLVCQGFLEDRLVELGVQCRVDPGYVGLA